MMLGFAALTPTYALRATRSHQPTGYGLFRLALKHVGKSMLFRPEVSGACHIEDTCPANALHLGRERRRQVFACRSEGCRSAPRNIWCACPSTSRWDFWPKHWGNGRP